MRPPAPSLRSRCKIALALLIVATTPVANAAETPPNPIVALERALADRPGDAVLAYFLALVRARAGDREGALAALEQTLQHGQGFLPPLDLFETLKDEPRFAVLRARFEKRLPVKTDGRIAFALPDRRMLPEGIAYDPRSRVFYVGSISRNAVYRIARNGKVEPFSRPGDELDAILGLAIDGASRQLYAVSTSALTEAGRAKPRNAIKIYDLARGRLQRTIEVPGARQLNDVARAPDGTLLVSDSGGGGVWHVDPASGSVNALIPLDTARGANGIAVAPRGDVAYVAAARRPLRVELATGAYLPLDPPAGENAAAIDGLYWHDGALIGIQNATTPARVVRLELAPDGRSIVAVQTLQSHHQRAFDQPTTAALAPDGLYVLARTQVSLFNDRGTIDRPETLAPPLILRIPLGGGRDRG